MLHIIEMNHRGTGAPAIVHFQSKAEVRNYFRDEVPEDIIATRRDLEAAKEKYKGDETIPAMLDLIDVDTLEKPARPAAAQTAGKAVDKAAAKTSETASA